MKTVLTVIVDNIGDNIGSDKIGSDKLESYNGKGEWGLSILVQHNGQNILVDTGASKLFAKNIKLQGFNLKDVDCGMLSHAHYDHSGGMETFFKENQTAKFYISADAKNDCYSKAGFFYKYIGIPKNILKKYPDRIKKITRLTEISSGAYLLPHTTTGLDKLGKKEKMFRKVKSNGLFLKSKSLKSKSLKSKWRYDDFSHEQSLVLDTEKGLVIVSPCSHGGVVNIINEVKSAFPNKHLYGIIGGFHLYNKSDEEVKNVAKEIKNTGIDFVCTGHCTKERAYNILKEELCDNLCQLKVGLKMEF